MKIFSLKSKKEKVKIRVVDKTPVLVPIRAPFKLRGAFLSMLVGLVFSGLFSYGVYVFAIPPTSPYTPGTTLNPSCTPGSANCTVSPPIYFTGSTLDIGSNNFVGTTPLQIKYNSSNYATLTVGSNGDLTISTTGSGGNINFNSPSSSNASILSNSGILNLGGGISGDESLNFDFHDYNNKVVVTSDTGVTSVDFGSLSLATTGSLTLGGSTAGTLVTRVTSGAPTESDTNGSLVVDSSTGRLYIRYGGAWHYIAQTGGFQIPNFETVDPVSGEAIVEGDFVVGMIDKSFEDGAVHGVWVRWETLKQQLAEEIALTGGLIVNSTSTVSGEMTELTVDETTETAETMEVVKNNSLLGKVKNVLSVIGIGIKDGITKIANLAVENLTANVARINKLELADSATGDIYCTWIENGEWKKEKGECSSMEVAVANSNSEKEENQAIQEAADEAAQTALEKVEEKLEEKVEEEVKQQLEEQGISSEDNQGQKESNEASDNNQLEENNSEDSDDAPGNSEESKEKSDEENGSKDKENKQDELIQEGATVEPTVIDILVENSTSALFEKMNILVNSVIESMKDWPQSSSEFSAGLMEPLKQLLETLFIEPVEKVSQKINSSDVVNYSLADLHGSSSGLPSDLTALIYKQAYEDLSVAVEISKFSQYNLVNSSLSLTKKTEEELLNLGQLVSQLENSVWIFNPSGLISEMSSNVKGVTKLTNNSDYKISDKVISDLTTYMEFSKFTQNNLASTSLAFNHNVQNIFMGKASLDESLEPVWILNPVGLVLEMKSDFSTNFKNLPSLAIKNQLSAEGALKNLSHKIFLGVQNSEIAVFNAGLLTSNASKSFVASLSEPLESMWILNPVNLINAGTADLQYNIKRLLEAHPIN